MTDTVPINALFAIGMKVSPTFNTSIIPLARGYEARNQNWPVALCRYDCTVKGNITQMQEFNRHVLGRRGAMYAFPLLDPLDNELVDEVIATGDGETTEFQTVKVYADADRPYRRPLSIVQDLVVKLDGVEQVLEISTTTSSARPSTSRPAFGTLPGRSAIRTQSRYSSADGLAANDKLSLAVSSPQLSWACSESSLLSRIHRRRAGPAATALQEAPIASL